jgi:hypothetical protein
MTINPEFPIYIPSKSRADNGLTARYLDIIKVPYRLVVEEEQFEQYNRYFPAEKLLILDPIYQKNFDMFWEFPDEFSRGSGPARNFIWDHSVSEGMKYHWTMDDNIRLFARLHKNQRIAVGDGFVFAAMEDFVQRYSNVAMAGPNYWMFAPSRVKRPPFTMNTRIYSCNLIRNDTPFRWRGRYNEDTDLSLRMLKDGWATVLFNTFLQYKMTTQTMTGGNTEAFYASEGTLAKSEMLAEQHPDVAKVVWRYKRWHHQVDYSPFSKLGLVKDESYTPKDFSKQKLKKVPVTQKIVMSSDYASG